MSNENFEPNPKIGGRRIQGGNPSNGQVLVFDAASNLWRYQDFGSAVSSQNVNNSATGDQVINAVVPTDITGLSALMPTNNGKSIIVIQAMFTHNADGAQANFTIDNGGVDLNDVGIQNLVVGRNHLAIVVGIVDNDGQTVKAQAWTNAGNLTIRGATFFSRMIVFSLDVG